MIHRYIGQNRCDSFKQNSFSMSFQESGLWLRDNIWSTIFFESS